MLRIRNVWISIGTGLGVIEAQMAAMNYVSRGDPHLATIEHLFLGRKANKKVTMITNHGTPYASSASRRNTVELDYWT